MNQLIPMERHDGVATVSSLEVAKDFHKEHKNVIRNVETIVASFQSAQNRADYSEFKNLKDYFIPGVYRDRKNRQQPMYFLTRDGFQLLAMGFTGEYALQWKLRYIKAFDQMETTIRKAIRAPVPTPITALEQTLEVLKGFDTRMGAIESKQATLEQAVNKIDWLTGAKQRVESITGRPLKGSGLFLARVYDEIEKSRGVCLESRRVRLYKKLKARGEGTYRAREISKLYIISLDGELRTAFDVILDRRKRQVTPYESHC